MNRQISRVALVGLTLLASLILATTYWQTWGSAGLAAREGNEIARIAQIEIKRGLIYAANGKTLLAGNIAHRQGGQTTYSRVYPNGDLASQTLGYSTLSGAQSGIEQGLDSYLTAANADLGTVFSTLKNKLTGTTVTGNNVVLTLNSRLQRQAQSLLASNCGAAVVLNPTTGAVLAIASSPGFNPNLMNAPDGLSRISGTPSPCAPLPAAPLYNRATQALYPPGSTFKVITAAAALDNGVYNLGSTFNDPGYCVEYGNQVHNALDQGHPEAYGVVNLLEAFQNSINAVFCNIGKRLGARAILDEARRFGFYSVPPLETPPGERVASGLYDRGRLFDPSTPSQYDQVDPGRLAFGQATMLTTPLQMALVAAAIANGGVEMTPTLVKRIASPGGSVITSLHPQVWRQATSAHTAAELRDMMVEVVQAGTGTAAQIPGVEVAGKTGTAETATGSNIYDAWFIFFAPATHPVVAGAVVVEHAVNEFGGQVAAPIAKQLIEALLPLASNPGTTTPAATPSGGGAASTTTTATP